MESDCYILGSGSTATVCWLESGFPIDNGIWFIRRKPLIPAGGLTAVSVGGWPLFSQPRVASSAPLSVFWTRCGSRPHGPNLITSVWIQSLIQIYSPLRAAVGRSPSSLEGRADLED